MKAKEEQRKLKQIEDQNKILKEQLELESVQVQNLTKQVSLLQQKKKLDEEITNQSRDYTTLLQDRFKRLKDSDKIEERQLARSMEQLNIEKDLEDIANKLTKLSKIKDDKQLKEYNLTTEQVNEIREQLKFMETAYKTRKADLPLVYAQIDAQKKLNEITAKFGSTIKGTTKFLDTIEAKIRAMPVVGDMLGDVLPFENVKKSIQDKVGKTLLNVFSKSSKSAEAVGAGLEGGMAAGTKGAMVFGTTLTVATAGILLVIGAIVMAMKFFVDTALEADHHVTGIAKNLNISKSAAFELEHSLGHQNEFLGKNAVLYENIVKYSDILHKNFGQAGAVLAKDVMPRMQELQHNMQLSDEELGSMVSTAAVLGTSFAGTADKASEFETSAINATKEFYEQRGIQITNADLMADVRENMQQVTGITKKSLAMYGKSTTELLKQVQTIRKLGLEFEQVVKISEASLDIENSVGNEMQANVLLGKSFNLNAVRYASIYGKVEDVAKAVNEQFEQQNVSLESFNDMIPFQKKQMAQLFGMGEDEIQQMLLRNKLQDTLTDKYADGGKEVLDNIRTGKTSIEDAKKLLVQQGNLTEEQAQQLILAERKTTVQQDMAMIQDQLTQSIKANMPGIQSFIKTIADFGTGVQKAGGLKNYILGGEIKTVTSEKTGKTADYETANILNIGHRDALEGLSRTFTDMFHGEFHSSLSDVITKIRKEKAVATSEVSGGGATGGWGTEQQDFISRPGQDPISFNRDDIIIGATSPFGGSSDNGDTMNILKEQNALLEQLIAATSGPVHIKIGSRAIEELDTQLSLRKNYNIGPGRGLGV